MPVHHQTLGDASLITIDNPPLNVLSHAVRLGLMAALDAAEAAGARRIVLAGAGRAFVAGADAREFDLPTAAPHLSEILARLESLPVIAAIGGVALGGGLEMALAARLRIAHPAATLGLPEVNLGLVPGAGGTQRLPRLVGIAAAAALISEARVIGADEALASGIVDLVADDPVAAAMTHALPDLTGRFPISALPAPAPDPGAVEAARKQAARRSPGQIAPQRAIDLVEASSHLPFAEALLHERAVFQDLRAAPQSAALRHLFFAERAARGRGRALPPPAAISRAIVAGGGTMGAGIAYALAGAGVHVTTVETGAEAAARAGANLTALYDEAVRRGKSGAAEAAEARQARHLVRVGYDALPPADIAIEAAFEDLDVKRAIFAALAGALPQTSILATNTSYLDVNAIFAGLPGPSRCLGLHFFAPAHLMKLLEVIRADATSPQTLATAFALGARLGKVQIESGVCEGFIGNRILTRYRQTGEALLLRGSLPEEVDAAMEAFGMAMGPFAVQDLSGLDIAHANRRRQRSQVGGAAVGGGIADRMVEELGRLGRKTGAGWYDYEGTVRRPSDRVAALVRDGSARAGITRRPVSPDEVREHALMAMIDEGLRILAEGIARSPDDIDLALVHGYGFPRWRGGPMHMAARMGLAQVLARLEALAKADPDAWPLPGFLRELVARGASLADLTRG
ncbi:MAG: 3-hydroxyacyl-CoA dehydrogenase NAD-binding domain-containing protein [Paracoccaceae bacterium]